MPLWTLISIVAVAGGIYVIIGGLRAVMITDTIQGVLLLSAGTFIFFMVFREFDWSWAAVREAAPEDGWTAAPPADDEFFPWPGIFTGAFFLGFYYWVANHMVVQKVLAAKSIDHGRWGALFAGFMQLPLLFILILPGLMGREIFPGIEDPDQIWPALVFDRVGTKDEPAVRAEPSICSDNGLRADRPWSSAAGGTPSRRAEAPHNARRRPDSYARWSLGRAWTCQRPA